MKVNFNAIVLKNVEGNEEKVNIRKHLGNTMYMQGDDIEECELGKRIYYAEGELEVTDKEAEIVRKFAGMLYKYVLRKAIEEAMK